MPEASNFAFMEKKHIRVITTFSGIDAQCMALDRVRTLHPGFSYELVRWCEIDPWASRMHDLAFPEWEGRNLGDITKVNWSDVHGEVGDIDLFTYSSPCQSFSICGRLEGGEEGSGTESSLLWECRKAIDILRPGHLVLENVKNLVGKRFMPLFSSWMTTLDLLGYNCYWKVMNARGSGIPQNRERVFLVSIREDLDDGTFVFPEDDMEMRPLEDFIEKDYEGHLWMSAESLEDFFRGRDLPDGEGVMPISLCDGAAHTIKANYGKTSVANVGRGGEFGATGVIEYHG